MSCSSQGAFCALAFGDHDHEYAPAADTPRSIAGILSAKVLRNKGKIIGQKTPFKLK
jgi:hypothetical protein